MATYRFKDTVVTASDDAAMPPYFQKVEKPKRKKAAPKKAVEKG